MRMWRNWQHRIRPLPVGDKGTFGVPKKVKAFLGKRKHNETMSFSERKTISEVCADAAQRSKFCDANSEQRI